MTPLTSRVAPFLAGAVLGGAVAALAVFFTLRSPDESPDHSTVVVDYRGGRVTRAEVDARLGAMSSFERHAALSSPEKKRKLAEDLAVEEYQAERARLLRYDALPEVRTVCDRALVDAYVSREFEAKVAPKDVPESELKDAFTKRLPAMSRPAQVRAAIILVSGTDAGKAKKVLQEAKKAQEKSVDGFAQVARARSEDPKSGPFGGELPFLSKDELARRVSPELADAAFALQKAGDFADLVETPKGFYLVRLLAAEPAVEPSFEAAEPTIKAQLLAARRERALADWKAGLMKDAEVKVHDDQLAGVTESASR